MFDFEDYWPLPNYSTGPTKHLHALGVISLNYNMFERGLVAVLEFYLDKPTAEFLFDKMSNEQRVGIIRQFARQREKDPVILDLIEHQLLYFGRCFENLNQSTRAAPAMSIAGVISGILSGLSFVAMVRQKCPVD
jgi:hypothetical protein